MAFLENDRLKARKVIARDLQVNRLHEETFATLVEMCKNEHEQSEVIAHLLTVSKSLERISDHAKNVAQSIVFMVEGQDLRHRGLQDKADSPDPPPLDEYSTGESFSQET